jgi:thiol-disulfide isomerase/thioredoxin
VSEHARTRRRTLLASAALMLGTVFAPPAVAVGVGHGAPEFDLPGTPGPVRLKALRGKVVYVDFWASWCGPCRQSFPWLNDMQARYGAHGFTVVGVNVDARRDDAERFLAQVPARFAIAFDPRGDTPGRYAAKGMPSSFLIDRDGRVVATHVGFDAARKVLLENHIRHALGMP